MAEDKVREALERVIRKSAVYRLEGRSWITGPDEVLAALKAEIAALAANTGSLSVEQVRRALSEHWLSQVVCFHSTKPDETNYDIAICACSRVNLPRKPTVGKAVGTWIEHVMNALRQPAGAPSEREGA